MSDDLADVFREELRDLLESLERGLLDLESTPDDMAIVNQVFRDLHTVKGSGAMFGYADLAAFIHRFETVFDRVRAGEARVTPGIVRLALEARDQIPGLVSGAPDPGNRRGAILAELEHMMADGADPAPAAATPPPVTTDLRPQRLTFRLTGPALTQGARPDLILDELRDLGATGIRADTGAVPPLSDLDPGTCALRWTMDLPATVGPAQIEEVFLFADADWSLDPVGPEPAAAAAPQPAATPSPTAPVAAAPAPPPAPAAVPAPAATHPPAATPEAATTLRVSAERLDAMMDAVGELVIIEARLSELARQSRDPALIATAEQITRLASGLRDTAMTMRMVPMKTLMARFRRLVSDLSSRLGRPVDFVVLGEDTELDKTVIEKLADPLVHILRNSMDHGIEPPEARTAAGKPPRGTITLSAEHAGGEVLIRLRDDGRGIDAARVRAKAVARGLVAPDTVMTERQALSLILEPGFSTAEEVTDLSGRGVGMDVVRRTIEGLRGTIEVASTPGAGTALTLRLPLTLAIIDGLLVEVGGERFTLPMSAVQEIVELPADRHAPERSADYLDIRGRFVPFLRLRSLFHCPGQRPTGHFVVVVASGDTRVGLVVDRVVGTNQTVIKQMSKLHADVREISGATILGDGSVALVLDVIHLVALGRKLAESEQAQARGAAA